MSVETLINGTFRALVPPPGFFALAHFGYGPGAFFPPAKGAGPVVFRVLEGTLEFEAEDVVTKTPAGTTTPLDMPPRQAFTVTVDDQLVVPGDVVHSARTVGGTPARILGLAVFGAAPAREFPEGITFEPLTLGPAAPLPAVPATASVRRVRLTAGSRYDLPAGDAPRIAHVESGTAAVTLTAGGGQYWQGKQPFEQPAALPAGAPVTLGQRDGVLLQAGAAITINGTESGEGSVLVASVGAAGTADSGPGAANKDLLRRYAHDVVDSGDPTVAERYIAANYYHHDRPPGQELGLDGAAAYLRAYFGAFTGLATTIEAQAAEDDVVVGRWSQTATSSGPYQGHAPTGKTVRLSGTTISRVRDGLIVEEWEEQDVAGLLEQLGAAAPLGELDNEGAGGAAVKVLASRYVYDVWSRGDLALIDELFAADFTNRTPLPGQRAGRDGVRQFVSRWRSAFPDVNVTIDLLTAEGGTVAARWTSRGTHQGGMLGVPPSGRYITVSGITMFTVRDGRIAEASQQWGVTAFLEQAGVVTTPSASEGR